MRGILGVCLVVLLALLMVTEVATSPAVMPSGVQGAPGLAILAYQTPGSDPGGGVATTSHYSCQLILNGMNYDGPDTRPRWQADRTSLMASDVGCDNPPIRSLCLRV